MNKALFKDAVVATLMVFALYSLPTLLVAHISFFDPVNVGIERIKKEYENIYIDITQGKLSNTAIENDSLIYLVNIDTLNRAGIAKLVENINSYHPKVIGVDIVFNQKDAVPNLHLASALKSASDKLVMGVVLRTNQEGEIVPQPERSDSVYRHGSEGFFNFVSAEENSVVRLFLPLYEAKNSKPSDKKPPIIESFATQIVKQFDSTSYNKFVAHRQEIDMHSPEVIVYQHQRQDYHQLQPAEFYEGNPELEELKGKIVLVGYMGDSTSLEDKHYSPFNVDGEQPDMSGMVIHANIIEMILRQDYVRYTPDWVVKLVSFSLCFLLMIFLIYQFVKYQLWFHLVFKLLQMVLGALAFGIGLWMFYSWQLKIDTLKIIVPIALTVDVLYFYNTLAKWLHEKIGYETYFDTTPETDKKTLRQLFIYLFKKYIQIQK